MEDEHPFAVVEHVAEELRADGALPSQPPGPLAEPGVVDVAGAVVQAGQGQAREQGQARPDQPGRQRGAQLFAGVTTMFRKRTLP